MFDFARFHIHDIRNGFGVFRFEDKVMCSEKYLEVLGKKITAHKKMSSSIRFGKPRLTFRAGSAIIKNAKSKIPGVMTLVNCFWHGGVNAPPFSFVIIAFFVVFCQEKIE